MDTTRLSSADLDPADAELKEFVKTSLVDLVTKRIRTGIFTGKYLPGQKLIVRELSENLGVSHTPVKDALNRLTVEGLVESIPNRSMIVRSFTNDELIEIMGVRLMCEVFYAGEIIARVAEVPSLVGDLQRIWDNMREIVNNPDPLDHEKLVEQETLFHRSYMSICSNRKLISVYNSLDANRFTYFAYLHNNKSPLGLQTYKKNLDEHMEIIKSIKSYDAEYFTWAVSRHIIRSCEEYEVDDSTIKKIQQIELSVQRYLSKR
jgi:DNA-binding GntR family transcriptional regulator